MDAIIKKANFEHNDDSVKENFCDLLEDWKREFMEKASAKDVQSALDALAKKLEGPGGSPKHETEGWEQASETLSEINKVACEWIDNNEDKKQVVQKSMFDFCVRILQSKINMLHMEMAKETLDDSTLSLKDYCKDVDKASVASLVKTLLKRPSLEEGVEMRDFWDKYERLWSFVLSDFITDDRREEFASSLMDFSVDLTLDSIFMDEKSCKELRDVWNTIDRFLDGMFKTTTDYERANSYLARCADIVSRPDFVPHENGAGYFKDLVDSIITDLGRRGILMPLYKNVMNLVMKINKCTYPKEKYVIRLFYETFVFFDRLPDGTVKPDAALFSDLANLYSTAILELDMKFLKAERFAQELMDDALLKAYGGNKTLTRQWLGVAITLLKRPCKNTMLACRTVVDNRQGNTLWKGNDDIVTQIFESWLNFDPPAWVDDGNEDEIKEIKGMLDNYKSAGQDVVDGLKKAKMLKGRSKILADIVVKFIKSNHKVLLEFAECIAEHIELNPKTEKAVTLEAIEGIHVELKDKSRPFNELWCLQRAVEDLIGSTLEPFKDGKAFTDAELQLMISACETCLGYDCIDQDTGQCPSAYFSIYLKITRTLFNWLTSLSKTHLAVPLIPGLLAILEADHEHAQMLVGTQLQSLLGGWGIEDSGKQDQLKESLKPYLGKMLTTFLETESDHLIAPIKTVYPRNVSALTPHFQSLVNLVQDSGNPSLVGGVAGLLKVVACHQPDLFKEADVEGLISQALTQPQSRFALVQVVEELAKRRPQLVLAKAPSLMDMSKWDVATSYTVLNILSTLSIHDESLAPKVLDMLLKRIKSSEDKNIHLVSLNSFRTIGFRHQELAKARREQIVKFQNSDPDVLNMKQVVLDMIDGKTPEATLSQLEEQQRDLLALAGRVDQVENDVNDLSEGAAKQGEQIQAVSEELSAHGGRVDQVEAALEETSALVEQIDQKTLSHAPFWSRDVSRLLNVQSEADWRLLGSRLGYSNDDLRGWAQQADPCMAMLNEWYATRKTSEASYGVLTQLHEMNRMDAAIIVENAMKNAEKIVEDDEEFEYAAPPSVFISYQWGHQPEVRLLQRHLEMAGFRCWLDLGQMGGGDKLFQKIDAGIRAAKVVICCVTDKYSKSPNCNREVNLSVNLQKALIPVLLEKCAWPPPGSMGPIFSEYLFIRLFQRPGEEMDPPDERFWPKDKFHELLMQLSGIGLTPDLGEIHADYRDWWMPVVQEIKIDRNKPKSGSDKAQSKSGDSKAVEEAAVSPDVFISYQWGKQSSILKLYELLTAQGFSCWLDVKQMGGGDSLFDKIDRGIRGCKVVLCCVTKKYGLSINCRREVSLASALNKPLLPLLLEKNCWPPAGSMGPVMAPLLYSDFTMTEKDETIWLGETFDALLAKIRSHIGSQDNATHPSKTPAKAEPQAGAQNNQKTQSPSTIVPAAENPSDGSTKTAPIVNPASKNAEHSRKPSPEHKSPEPKSATSAKKQGGTSVCTCL